MTKKPILVTALMLVLAAGFTVLAGGNLAQNPSFENEFDGKPVSWDPWAWDGKPGATEFKLESGAGHTGGKFIAITNIAENDARYRQTIAVKTGTFYRLSAWVRTENVGTQKMGANVSVEGSVYVSPDVRGTSGQWQYVEMYLHTGGETQSITITAGLGGYGSINVGKAFFDDVSLEEVAQAAGKVAPIGEAAPQSGGAGQPAGGRPPWLVFIGVAVIAAIGYCAYRYFRPQNSGSSDETQGAGQVDRD